MCKNQEQKLPNLTIFDQKIQLQNQSSRLEISLFGGQILSYTQNNKKDALWLSKNISPRPAAIRGGIPICWPWFARQGVDASLPQHGPVRNMPWKLLSYRLSEDLCELQLSPEWDENASHLCDQAIQEIQNSKKILRQGLGIEWNEIELIQTVQLSDVLVQSLETHNKSDRSIVITQALHSYFSVSNAMQVKLMGFEKLAFTDSLQKQNFQANSSGNELQLDPVSLPCIDRIYHLDSAHPQAFQIVDDKFQNTVQIEARGSQSIVVWNPGEKTASQMKDIGEQQWSQFFCLEVANALPNAIELAPSQKTKLCQVIRSSSYHS